MVVGRLAQPVQPVHHRVGIDDRPAVVGQAHGRNDEMHRILELLVQRSGKLRRCKDHAQHGGDVTVAAPELLGHGVDQQRIGIAADEITAPACG
jgi:hypothetical protein